MHYEPVPFLWLMTTYHFVFWKKTVFLIPILLMNCMRQLSHQSLCYLASLSAGQLAGQSFIHSVNHQSARVNHCVKNACRQFYTVGGGGSRDQQVTGDVLLVMSNLIIRILMLQRVIKHSHNAHYMYIVLYINFH